MDIHDELNDPEQTKTQDPKSVSKSTVAALVLLGGALIATPLIQQNRQRIEQAATQATASGRDLAKRVADKLPWAKRRKD